MFCYQVFRMFLSLLHYGTIASRGMRQMENFNCQKIPNSWCSVSKAELQTKSSTKILITSQAFKILTTKTQPI